MRVERITPLAPLLARLAALRPLAHRRPVTPGSAGVIAAGGYWLAQRLFFA